MEQGTLRIENRAVPDLVPLVWDTPGIEAAIPKDAVGQAVTMRAAGMRQLLQILRI